MFLTELFRKAKNKTIQAKYTVGFITLTVAKSRRGTGDPAPTLSWGIVKLESQLC